MDEFDRLRAVAPTDDELTDALRDAIQREVAARISPPRTSTNGHRRQVTVHQLRELEPAPSPRPALVRRWDRRLVVVVAAAAAVIVAIALVANTRGSDDTSVVAGPGTEDPRRELHDLAAQVANGPEFDAAYEYEQFREVATADVMVAEGDGRSDRIETMSRVWVSADRDGRAVVEAALQGGPTPEGMTAGTVVLPAGSDRLGPPLHELATWPTDGAALASTIASSGLGSGQGNEQMVTAAGELLARPGLPPGLRAGLLQLLADDASLSIELESGYFVVTADGVAFVVIDAETGVAAEVGTGGRSAPIWHRQIIESTGTDVLP